MSSPRSINSLFSHYFTEMWRDGQEGVDVRCGASARSLPPLPLPSPLPSPEVLRIGLSGIGAVGSVLAVLAVLGVLGVLGVLAGGGVKVGAGADAFISSLKEASKDWKRSSNTSETDWTLDVEFSVRFARQLTKPCMMPYAKS